jgi:hypothetical protein
MGQNLLWLGFPDSYRHSFLLSLRPQWAVD